jgi:SHS2 domain-containing protein
MTEKTKFEFLPHTADIKFRAYGTTLNELFENIVLAISSIISKDQKISTKKGKMISVSGDDSESLLYNFIDELIYLFDAESFIPVKAKVTLMGFNLKAELFGDDAKNYKDLDSIKAATYSEMFIKKNKDIWTAQAVVDV